MGNIVAIANQKGGVGKTTSAVNISAELAEAGNRVLLIDFDPQANATSGLGVDFNEEGQDLYDMFLQDISLSELLRDSVVEGLDVAPASKDLISIEVEIGKKPGRELILKSELKLLTSSYDYIFIDCPPSSGLLTLNALAAADYVLIPLQAEYYALEGITGLMKTVGFVRDTINTDLDILGVFITMYDSRTRLSEEVLSEAKNHFKKLTFKSVIPRSIRLSESPSHGLPIGQYAPKSSGAVAYRELAEEIDKRCIRNAKKKAITKKVANL